MQSNHAKYATILANTSLKEVRQANSGSQWFTTLRELQDSRKYRNIFTKDKYNSSIIAIRTEPPVAIGQRAFLLRSPAGNILWDCITYMDDETVSRIVALGGIDAIVISHPHFFSTALHWAEAFGCKVYISAEDAEWLTRQGDAHIPLSPDAVFAIWKAISVLDFDDAHSAFLGRDARGDAKRRLLESAQIFIASMGHIDHPIRYEEI
ncbi:putative metallo-beta-lactamase superfamily protein [Colletotrichum sublineola]|uniref:Putative metallo-beta-lactamase superfamily protein n=1 Tax=Colletotrichum sublineola TaxID=1173701 RepID=A0A066X1L5_COLSU|nr:putative metallo-beta-lactamase superfamily protein [Colletotrichum sublineola]